MALFCLLAVPAAWLVMAARGVPFSLTAAQLPLLLYFGLVPLGLSFVLWERAVQGCNLQVLGSMSFFTPALSTLMLAAVSGQAVGGAALAGLGLILAGSALGKFGA